MRARDLAVGKEVTLQTYGLDKYGRTLADVLLPDGVNLNQELVKQSWCWWYRKYAPFDREAAKRFSFERLIDLRNEPAHNPARQRTRTERGRMDLPYWVEEDIRKLPADFTGQLVLEVWRGGVTRVDTKTCRHAPKPGEMKRDVRK